MTPRRPHLLALVVLLTYASLPASPQEATSPMDQDVIQLFAAVAETGRLPDLLARRRTFNLNAPTLGGRVFWTTYAVNGWRLQLNAVSGWWRILDSAGTRVARGTTAAQLRDFLEDRPSSILGNYLERGHCFSKTAAVQPTGRSAILIHGLSVRARSMQALANELAKAGYDAYSYDYPSSKLSLEQHAALFAGQFRRLLAQLPPEERLHVLTHSMGGLVLRGALAQLSEEECRRIDAIVMLGPPNLGSKWAYLGKIPLVDSLNAALGDMMPTADSYTMNIPPPAWMPPVGIIAGKWDGKVALEDTWLPAPLACQHIVVDATHPGLRNPRNVLKPILEFFQNRRF